MIEVSGIRRRATWSIQREGSQVHSLAAFRLSRADYWVGTSRAESSRVESSRAEPCRAVPCRAVPCSAEPYRAKPSQTLPSQDKPSQAKPSQAKLNQAKSSRAESEFESGDMNPESSRVPSQVKSSRGLSSPAEPSLDLRPSSSPSNSRRGGVGCRLSVPIHSPGMREGRSRLQRHVPPEWGHSARRESA